MGGERGSGVWVQPPSVGESSLPAAAVYHRCLPALSFLLSLAFTQVSPAQDPSMAPTALRNNSWALPCSRGRTYGHRAASGANDHLGAS